MEQLVLLGYETTIVRLPCSNVKIRKNLDRIDLEYEEINETFSLLKKRQIMKSKMYFTGAKEVFHLEG